MDTAATQSFVTHLRNQTAIYYKKPNSHKVTHRQTATDHQTITQPSYQTATHPHSHYQTAKQPTDQTATHPLALPDSQTATHLQISSRQPNNHACSHTLPDSQTITQHQAATQHHSATHRQTANRPVSQPLSCYSAVKAAADCLRATLSPLSLPSPFSLLYASLPFSPSKLLLETCHPHRDLTG